MLRAMAIAACLAAAYATTAKAEGDNLDARIARIEKENAQLKKLLKIQDLERENASLRARVGNGTNSHANVAVVTAAPAAPAPQRQRSSVPASTDGTRVETAHQEASAAFAKYVPPEPTPITKRWQGFYAGGHAGMGFGSWSSTEQLNSLSFPGFAVQSFTSEPIKLSSTGAVVGGQAGYSWQIGSFVFGPEADVSVSTIGAATRRYSVLTQTCTVQFCTSGSIRYAQTAGASVEWLSSLRAKVGWGDDRWQFFVSGGLAAAGISNEMTGSSFDSGSTVRETTTIVGYAVGAGLAYAISPQVSFRAEYLRYEFPDTNRGMSTRVSTFGEQPSATYSSINMSTNVVRAGFDWRFN